MAIGRISGQLLKDDLIREGRDLAFETDLLYLKVSKPGDASQRIGINTATPQYDLDVNGTTRTTSLEATNTAQIADIKFDTNRIYTTAGTEIQLGVADNVFYQKKLLVDDITLDGNTISTSISNANLELRPNGAGKVEVYSDMNVYGNIYATGNIRADGNIIIGDQDTDSITVNAQVVSNIIPNEDNTYTLGNSSKKWADIWVNDFNATNVTTDGLIVDGVNIVLRQGNIIYVAENGDDTNTGTHPQDPVSSIKHALSLAGALPTATTIHIFPGQYQEEFPLTIPSNVTLKGHSLRSVKIVPTVATQNNDAILLNGESTVEDLTIADFYSPGYAFKFAPGFTVTTRSPYVRNVSVITEGSVTSVADPRGFDAGDAGRGAYLDGAVATSTSREASGLFHSVTFITPGVDAITITNGTRVEWLNCFTYFANRGLYAFNGTTGLKGTGRTAIRISDITGTPVVGDTFEYYDTDNTTLLATGTVEEIDGNKIYLTGNVSGIVEVDDVVGKTVTANNTAQLSVTQKKFGTTSLSVLGATDSVSLGSETDFAFGTGDFTVEGYIYPTSVAGTFKTIFDFRTTQVDSAIYLGYDGNDNLIYYVNGATVITGSTAITVNTWHHVAISRSGGTTKIFLNGNQEGNSYTDNTNFPAKPLVIGADRTNASGVTGYIDEVRVSNSARYTTNFTVPLSEFPRDINTLLLLHFNGTDGSTTIEDDSLIDQDIRFIGSNATAKYINLVDYTDFGGEIRSIASASVYGNYGAYGDGTGVIMYLISHNLAYIGNGKETSNDPNTVIQANEIVELNDAKVRYSSVDHKGDFRVGDLFYVNQETGTVTFTSAEINVDAGNGFTFTDGANTTIVDGSKVQTGNIKISGNTIESLVGDVNITAASGEINFLDHVSIDGNLDVTGNVTVGGNITIGDENTDSIEFVAGINSDIIPRLDSTYSLGTANKNWLNLYAINALVDDIQITNNFITTTASNADLDLRANGTGYVIVDDLKFRNNEISSALDVQISSATRVIDINTSGSLNIPVGTTLERPSVPQNGMIRYNIDNNVYEGYNGNWIALNGVYDLDLDTKITAELTPGSNDGVIRFYNQGTVSATIDSTGLTAGQVDVDDINIDGNTITTTPTNQNLILQANGTGSVVFENLAFRGSTITNIVPNSSTVIENTGTGYFKVNGTSGFVFPVGNSTNRPLPIYTEVGMTRFNTDDRRLEVWDGDGWESVAGASGAISAVDAEYLAVEIVLTLG